MSVAQGTHMSGRSRRPQGYVYFETASQTEMYSQPFVTIYCHYILNHFISSFSDLLPDNSAVSHFSVCPQMRTNVPSWCDRILWKSYPETHIVCNSYGELNHSTHICFSLVLTSVYVLYHNESNQRRALFQPKACIPIFQGLKQQTKNTSLLKK